jgi:hypothetical protein
VWSQNGEALPMAETARTSFGRRVPRKADWSPGQGTGQGPPWREQVPGARPWVQETQPGRREHAPNAMDNFCFDVTLSYRRLERPRRVTARQ